MYADEVQKPAPLQAARDGALSLQLPMARNRLADRLNGSARVQSQLRLGEALNRNPHAVAQPKPMQPQRAVVQRIVLPLDDLEALKKRTSTPTKTEQDAAEIISNAANLRTKATREAVARPWDVRYWPFKSGPLDGIGNEEIRIYGHGATPKDSDVALRVGGYTPAKLVELLKELGLRSSYAGLIYLTGCKTAAGPDWGYLGTFYDLLKAYAPAVRVRGNLGNAITLDDGKLAGKQAIFKTGADREAFIHLRNSIKHLVNLHNQDVKAENLIVPKTVDENRDKQGRELLLKNNAHELKVLEDQIRTIHFESEDSNTLTVELPGASPPSFGKTETIDTLIGKSEDFSTSSVSFNTFKKQQPEKKSWFG